MSGYFSGVAEARGNFQAAAPGAVTAIVPARQDSPAAVSMKILYASETGNAAELARQFASRAQQVGIAASVEDLARYKTRALKDETMLLFVASTHGEGEPAEPALPFFEFLAGRKAPALPQLRFAVLALGDSTYEFFCQAGKTLDRRLEELGAQRLFERCDCDVDYEADAGRWIDAVLGLLQGPQQAGNGAHDTTASSASNTTLGFAVTGPVPQPLASTPYSKANPFLAQVVENIRITGRGSSKDTRHIELALDGSGLTYEPGDALGVVPQNDPALVAELLDLFGWSGSERVAGRHGELELRRALQSEFEITAATPRFIEKWAELSGDKELAGQLAQKTGAERAAFMAATHIIDLVKARPAPGTRPQDFVAALRGLQPRLYSIASSPEQTPDEVHLCVAPVRYRLHQRERHGVASVHLADRLQGGDSVPIYLQRNEHFRLPSDPATPIIMIGAGTGVAPYRAFLQQREALQAPGRNWLFFGERHFRTDFLYQTEWQEWLRSGLLSRAELAFSRDQQQKIYVQHKLREKGAELFDWISDGAHLYVCGDAEHMAADVHGALLAVIGDQRGRGSEDAQEFLRELQGAGRYQKDVY